MNCPQCGYHNLDDARFCAECGERQGQEGARGAMTHRTLYAEGDAGGGASPPESDIPERGLGDILSETLNLVGRSFLPVFILAFIIQVPTIVGLYLDPADSRDEFNALTSIVLPVVSLLISIICSTAALFCVCFAASGQRVDLGTAVYRAFGVLFPAAVVTIIVALVLILCGILMIIIIGIPLFFFFLVIWFFALPVVVVEGLGGIKALGRSRQHTRGSWWRLFGIGVVFALLMAVYWIPVGGVLIAMYFIFDAAIPILVGVAAALIATFYYCGSIVVYLDLRLRKEGYTLQALTDDLARKPVEERWRT